jgi:hypothetical protein
MLIAGKRYAATPRGQYAHSKAHARHRGIGFLLTFEEWAGIWRASGHWEQRGNRKDEYNMMRLDDLGPYAAGNVRIGKHRENTAERNISYRKFKRSEVSAAVDDPNGCPF